MPIYFAKRNPKNLILLLQREKAVLMSQLIEQKYEDQFHHKATEFVDKMVEQFEMRRIELEKQYKESKQRAEEAEERTVEAALKADDTLKQANLVEDHARHAMEKAQMMEKRYLEMISRGDQTSERMEAEKVDDALKRASVMEEQARQAIERMTQKADDALKQASLVEEQARLTMEKAQMMERGYSEMMSRGNQTSE